MYRLKISNCARVRRTAKTVVIAGVLNLIAGISLCQSPMPPPPPLPWPPISNGSGSSSLRMKASRPGKHVVNVVMRTHTNASGRRVKRPA